MRLLLMMYLSINKAFKIACIYSVGLDFYNMQMGADKMLSAPICFLEKYIYSVDIKTNNVYNNINKKEGSYFEYDC